MSDKVTVIIPTYNRWSSLLVAVDSVKTQTHKNWELIIVSDGSTDPEYENAYFGPNIKYINLETSSRDKFGFPSVGYVINRGFEEATGDYISFLDDDDAYLPSRLEEQIKAMKETGCEMACSDGLIGYGTYDKDKNYIRYNAVFYKSTIEQIHKASGSKAMANGFPKIWNKPFIQAHNSVVACSVLMTKALVDKVGKQLEIKMGGTEIDGKIVYIDYDYWLRALDHTDAVYLDKLLFYYDLGHGKGQSWRETGTSTPPKEISQKYEELCKTPSDINEHLPTLKSCASKCKSILELGVRNIVSTYAFIYGLVNPVNLSDNTYKPYLLMNDLVQPNLDELIDYVKALNIQVDFIKSNNLHLDIKQNFDMIFIDTWHVYGQLKRELAKFGPLANKYIILHDTTVDGDNGETVRNGWDVEKQSEETGIPVDEIKKGLWQAVEEFLNTNTDWKLGVRYHNCNGLTILKKVVTGE